MLASTSAWTSYGSRRSAEIDGGWYFFELPAPPATTAQLTHLRDRMCACAADSAPSTCADKIQHGVELWMRGVEDPDLLAIQAEIAQCRAKATRGP